MEEGGGGRRGRDRTIKFNYSALTPRFPSNHTPVVPLPGSGVLPPWKPPKVAWGGGRMAWEEVNGMEDTLSSSDFTATSPFLLSSCSCV